MNRYRFAKIFAAFERKILSIEDATATWRLLYHVRYLAGHENISNHKQN